MAPVLSWKRENATLFLSGELDSESILPLWQQREDVVVGLQILDLSGLTRVDTAGLALLIHFIARVKKQGGNVQLQGVRENLQTLSRLYNLPENLLPCATS